MNLRPKLIILLGTLAVVPLVVIGVIDYVRYLDALEDLIESQTSVIAEQAADDVTDKFTTISANLALLSSNVTIAKLVAAPSASLLTKDETDYLTQLQRLSEGHFGWVQVRGRDGEVTQVFSSRGATPQSLSRNWWVLSAPVELHGDIVGAVEVGVNVDSLLSRTLLDSRFGRRGATALVEVRTGDIVRTGAGHQVSPRATTMVAAGWGDTARTRPIRTSEADVEIAGVLVRAPGSPFAVLSLANVSEFSGAFGSNRNRSLATVFTLSMIVATLVLILLWRATRSLALLTEAADEVGRGNLNPRLPLPDEDELGRLASAFDTMTRRLRETLREIDRSRKMAAVGAFSSQIAHEIRTPLTSIKLNLQTLERASRGGHVADDLAEPIEISLREARRLDQVVRGVLQLGRGKVERSSSTRLAEIVADAVQSMRPTLEQHAVTVSMTDRSDGHLVLVDRSLLTSAVQNLLLNATEAMPKGGRIGIDVADSESDGRPVSRLTITDEGIGIPDGMRDQVFQPFFTTKPNGSGLGLALAHRTVEEHGGKLWADERSDGTPGAAFVVELPVHGTT